MKRHGRSCDGSVLSLDVFQSPAMLSRYIFPPPGLWVDAGLFPVTLSGSAFGLRNGSWIAAAGWPLPPQIQASGNSAMIYTQLPYYLGRWTADAAGWNGLPTIPRRHVAERTLRVHGAADTVLYTKARQNVRLRLHEQHIDGNPHPPWAR